LPTRHKIQQTHSQIFGGNTMNIKRPLFLAAGILAFAAPALAQQGVNVTLGCTPSIVSATPAAVAFNFADTNPDRTLDTVAVAGGSATDVATLAGFNAFLASVDGTRFFNSTNDTYTGVGNASAMIRRPCGSAPIYLSAMAAAANFTLFTATGVIPISRVVLQGVASTAAVGAGQVGTTGWYRLSSTAPINTAAEATPNVGTFTVGYNIGFELAKVDLTAMTNVGAVTGVVTLTLSATTVL
jgi:hypothetical protein